MAILGVRLWFGVALLLACGCEGKPKWDNNITETASFTNLQFTESSFAAIEAAAANGIKAMLPVFNEMFSRYRLRPDWSERIDALAANGTLQRLLTSGDILGFFLGDELVWNCMPQSNLTAAVDGLRRKYPRGSALLWYNEAAFFRTLNSSHDSCGHLRPEYRIPSGLDWFSVDIYHMNGLVDGWVQKYPQAYYETAIYPNITDSQQVVLVPGSFGSHVNRDCNNSCYDESVQACGVADVFPVMCSHDAQDFFAWANSDSRIAAIAPWNWNGCKGCNGSKWTPPHTCCMDEIGTREQPLTRAAWAEIGKSISGK